MRFNSIMGVRRSHPSLACAEARLAAEGFSKTLTVRRWEKAERGGKTIAQIEYADEQWITRKYWRER